MALADPRIICMEDITMIFSPTPGVDAVAQAAARSGDRCSAVGYAVAAL
jgi:hypothetical protein